MRLLETACSTLAGTLSGAAWLLWVDAIASGASPLAAAHLVPGVLSFVGLLMLNVINWETVIGEYANPFESDEAGGLARCWIFVALCVSFGGVISALWIFFALQDGSGGSGGENAVDAYARQCVAWQCVLIFCSALLFRASRTGKSEDT